MATPQVQTVQRSPLEDLQKWMPIIQTMLANKSANKLAQKNEMGQLLQLKMKQMESGYTEEDQKQLELMQKQHFWMKGSHNLTDSIKSILGLEKPPDTTPMLALSRLANPPSSMQAQGTLPNVPEMGEKPSPQDVPEVDPQRESLIQRLWNPAEFDQIRNAIKRQPMKGGVPIVGGKSYQEAEKNADTLARQIYMKIVEGKLAKEGTPSGGYYIPRGTDPQTGKVVVSHSKRPGLMFEDGTEYTGKMLNPLTSGRTPASIIQATSIADTMLEGLKRIRTKYRPEFIGPVAGRATEIQENWIGMPEEQAAFYADVKDISDQLLRMRSGAQINEQEYARLVKLVPHRNLPPSVFIARLNRFEQAVNDVIESKKHGLSGGGYMGGRGGQPQAAPPVVRSTRIPGQY